MSAEAIKSVMHEAAMPLAFNTRNGVSLENAGVFRDAEGSWWSIQARKLKPNRYATYDMRATYELRQDNYGRVGHISFVRLGKRPAWLTTLDKSNLQMALQLNELRYSKTIKLYRSQDEADEEFAEAHESRGMFVKRGGVT